MNKSTFLVWLVCAGAILALSYVVYGLHGFVWALIVECVTVGGVKLLSILAGWITE